MRNRVSRSSSNSWIGILLIVIGLIFLLDALDVISFGHFFAHWWPILLILLGLIKLKGHQKTGGVILLIVGVLFLLTTLDLLDWNTISQFWPVILVVIGLAILLRSGNRNFLRGAGSSEASEDIVSANAIFGGVDRIVASSNFRGCDVLAMFGGIDLDLRKAQVSPEGCSMNLTALFGGIGIVVPPNWQVIVSGTPVFGGIDDKTTLVEGDEGGIKVHCKCWAMFGGIEIKN